MIPLGSQSSPLLSGLLLILLQVGCLAAHPASHGKPLLFFLLDGFRADYFKLFQKAELGGFNWLMDGVKADHMKPVFPSLSYPNHYSIMTGE